MTRQEQIDEMAKHICNVCEMGHGFSGDCSEGGQDYYKRCTLTQETAKALYNAGYHKTPDGVNNQEQVRGILEVIKHCGDYTGRDCAECDYRLYGQCHNQKQCEAEALYNAGYKQLPDSLQLTSDYHRYKKGFEKACKLLSRYMGFEIPEIQEKLLSMAEEEL